MNAITAVYLLLLLGGIAWIVYRVHVYLRAERERDSRWVEMASDKRLTAQMESRKKTPGGLQAGSWPKSRGTRPARQPKTGEPQSKQVRKSQADKRTAGSHPGREDENR